MQGRVRPHNARLRQWIKIPGYSSKHNNDRIRAQLAQYSNLEQSHTSRLNKRWLKSKNEEQAD